MFREVLQLLFIFCIFLMGCSNKLVNNNQENYKLLLIAKETPKIIFPGKGEYVYDYFSNQEGEVEWKLEIYQKGRFIERKSVKNSVKSKEKGDFVFKVNNNDDKIQWVLILNNKEQIITTNNIFKDINFSHDICDSEKYIEGKEEILVAFYGNIKEKLQDENLDINKYEENIIKNYDAAYFLKISFKK
ncbi:MAG TPA: hypothetical protein PL122_07410 [Bacteroidales bacterium]|nr:hypothetical protein [Bacteroidales bacterium]